MIALLGNKLVQYLLAGVAAILIFGGYSYYMYNKGYNSAALSIEAQYKKKYDDELARQLEVQDKVKNSQNQIIADLTKQNDDLDQKLKENESEASKDSNGGNISLTHDAVLRLNKIR